jgi:hypothetical protein
MLTPARADHVEAPNRNPGWGHYFGFLPVQNRTRSNTMAKRRKISVKPEHVKKSRKRSRKVSRKHTAVKK